MDISSDNISTIERFSSEKILKKGSIDISSASIRSILADLQKEGLLYAPHTSSGRLPTDKGMRLFVDGLLEFGRLTKNEQANNALRVNRGPPPEPNLWLFPYY